MPRRLAFATALVALALTACSGGRREQPDVLLISLDSVRADDLTFADPEACPNLSALAERGTIFTQALSGTSWTLPSHLQMFTGLPPARHGVHSDDARLDPLIPSLPQVLGEAGWQNLGLWTGWYLAGEYGFDRGFDVYRSAMSADDGALEDAAEAGGDLVTRRESFRAAGSNALINSHLLVDRALSLLGHLRGNRPLFLFAHLYDPHFDYIPPEPWDRRFDPDYAGTLDGWNYWKNPRVWTPQEGRVISDRDLEHVRSLYRGEIGWTDQELGRLLAGLERAGRLDNTVIVVTADHGEEFFEHGDRGHRQTLYDEVLRVPLLVVPPRGASAVPRCDALVSLSDLLPTILDYAGLPEPDGVYGRSLRPLVEGGSRPERPVLATLWTPRGTTPDGRGHIVSESLRTSRDKFVRVLRIDPRGVRQVISAEWFDLLADPEEQNPETGFQNPRVREGWTALEEELAAVRQTLRERPHSPDEERLTGVAGLFKADLAALGYAGGSGDEDAEPLLGPWTFRPPPPLRLK